MDPRELAILEEIEAELTESDARFAARMAAGPSPTLAYRLWLTATTMVGVVLVMMFPANILFGVAGYMVLVAAGTTILRHRKARTDDESLLSAFHRLTAGLFRNTTPATQDSSEY
jgi:hypothetical protein